MLTKLETIIVITEQYALLNIQLLYAVILCHIYSSTSRSWLIISKHISEWIVHKIRYIQIVLYFYVIFVFTWNRMEFMLVAVHFQLLIVRWPTRESLD